MRENRYGYISMKMIAINFIKPIIEKNQQNSEEVLRKSVEFM